MQVVFFRLHLVTTNEVTSVQKNYSLRTIFLIFLPQSRNVKQKRDGIFFSAGKRKSSISRCWTTSVSSSSSFSLVSLWRRRTMSGNKLRERKRLLLGNREKTKTHTAAVSSNEFYLLLASSATRVFKQDGKAVHGCYEILY